MACKIQTNFNNSTKKKNPSIKGTPNGIYNTNKNITKCNKMSDNSWELPVHMSRNNKATGNLSNNNSNEPEQELTTKTSDTNAITKIKAGTAKTATTKSTIEMPIGAKLTLRKSVSTPALPQVDNVAGKHKSCLVGDNNNRKSSNSESADSRKVLIISANKVKATKSSWRNNKVDDDGGGCVGGGVGGGGSASDKDDNANAGNEATDHNVKYNKHVITTTTTAQSLPAVICDVDLRFGCAHYKRRAMFVTPCCNKCYKCRFCHDENESHHFDRKTLTELICSECGTRQKVQEQCEACGTRFGRYTCLVCNLFDDTDKKQYHCNGCGICRIGGAENFFHCKVCDMCLPIRLQIDGHRCVENISRSHCPVCLGDIHTSRIPCHIPDCGHLLHKTCFDQLLNSGHYTCPICQTSLIDMAALWEYLDDQAVSLPMPKKYENEQLNIFCNDCHKTSKTRFNFIGLKCMQCGAYNTTQDVKRRISLVADEPSSA